MNKNIIIKDLNHAIDLTIALHKKALKEHKDYRDVKFDNIPNNWDDACPLCEYTTSKGKHTCKNCAWMKFQNEICIDSNLDYYNSKQSIERLEAWKQGKKYINKD